MFGIKNLIAGTFLRLDTAVTRNAKTAKKHCPKDPQCVSFKSMKACATTFSRNGPTFSKKRNRPQNIRSSSQERYFELEKK